MKEKVFFDALGVNIKIDEDDYSNEFLTLMREFSAFSSTYPTTETRVHRNYYLCIIFDTEFYKIFFNYNGTNKGMGVFVEVKGSKGCRMLCEFLSTHNYRWSLTRADIAMDFQSTLDTNYFDLLMCDLMAYSVVNRIDHVQTVGDWINQKYGRTLYVGSKKSNFQVRLYEKTKEQHEKGNTDYPDNIIRVEVQFRPSSLQKKHINILTPLDVLRVNSKLLKLYSKYTNVSVEPVVLGRPPEKTTKDSLDYALNLYSNKIISYIEEVGYYSAVRYILSKIRLLYKLKKGL